MSNLKIRTNLEENFVNFESDFSSYSNKLEIEISVPKQGDYDNLSFEFVLSSEGNLIKQQLFPNSNEKYITSDQEFMERYVVSEITEDTTYDILFWCEEGGERFENSYTFTTPPYPSWVLNEETANWESPLGAAPELTEEEIEARSFYRWDEDGGDWVLETLE